MVNKKDSNDTVNLHEWMSRLKQIEEKTKRLSLLSRLGQILNSTLDHQEVRRRAMEAATQLMKAEVGSLLLIDEEKHQLYFEVALGDKEETSRKITLNIGEGIAGWVAQNGEPLIINAPDKDPRFYRGVDEKTEITTRNIICVPVKVKKIRSGFWRRSIRKKERLLTKKTLAFIVSAVSYSTAPRRINPYYVGTPLNI